MKSMLLLTALVAATNLVAAEPKCQPVLEVGAELKITANYEGTNYSEDLAEGEKPVVMLEKGEEYYFSADIELVKERKSKCEYKATNLSLTGNGFKWTSNKKVDARLELNKKGDVERFHINGFRPTFRKTVTLESGKRKRVQFDGERPLYIAATYSHMDDTSVVFKGPLAYFDFGDGHEYFGTATVSLSQD